MGNTCSAGLQQNMLTEPSSHKLHPAPQGPRGTFCTAPRVWDTADMLCGNNPNGEEKRDQGKQPRLRHRKSSLPVTHKLHTGLVQVDGLPQGLSSCSYLSQLTRQVLHQGQELSPDIVALALREGKG